MDMLQEKQYLFDKISTHLLTQKEKSFNHVDGSDIGGCFYRLSKGDRVLMCAVGCLITDENYNKFLEFKSARTDDVVKAVSKSVGFDVSRHGVFLKNLQNLHDDFDPDDWEVHLHVIAQENNLTLPAIFDEETA